MRVGYHILETEVLDYLRALPRGSIYLLVDRTVYDLHTERLAPLLELSGVGHCLLIDGGEEHKGLTSLQKIWHWLLDSGATRRSTVVVIGGGVLTDMGGFAAATYMRGIDSVHIPTTLLGMVDASVGGKTAIDFAGVKNIIGAFHEPKAVFVDVAFLETLPLDELYSGYAEVIKTALLDGADFWRDVLRLGDPQMLMPEEWSGLIARAIAYKERIVAEDPRESGLRRVLNLGHTVGHALEAYSHTTGQKPLLHGEAVVIGLLVETYLAVMRLDAEPTTLRQLHTLARELYRPYHYTCHSYDELWSLMRHDKKNDAAVVCMVLLAPGRVEELRLSDIKEMKEALDFYRETFGS